MLAVNAQDRSDLTILMGMVTDLRQDMTGRFDAQDVRLRRLEDRAVAGDAVADAAAKAASHAAKAVENARLRKRDLVAIASAGGTFALGVAGLALKALGVIH